MKRTPEEQAAAWAKRKKAAYMEEYRRKNQQRLKAYSRDYYRKHNQKSEENHETK
jgi:hypothetical protein